MAEAAVNTKTKTTMTVTSERGLLRDIDKLVLRARREIWRDGASAHQVRARSLANGLRMVPSASGTMGVTAGHNLDERQPVSVVNKTATGIRFNQCDQCDPSAGHDKMRSLKNSLNSHGRAATTRTRRQGDERASCYHHQSTSGPCKRPEEGATGLFRWANNERARKVRVRTAPVERHKMRAPNQGADLGLEEKRAHFRNCWSGTRTTRNNRNEAAQERQTSKHTRRDQKESRKRSHPVPSSGDQQARPKLKLAASQQIRPKKLFLAMVPFEETRLQAATQLAFCLHSVISLLVLLQPLVQVAAPARAHGTHDSDLSSVLNHQNSDLLTVLPPFAPTRRPNGLNVSHGARNSLASFYEPAFRQPGSGGLGERPPPNNGPTILHGSASVISGSSVPHNFHTGAGAGAGTSGKFARFNELDTFLDEMNHNELETVAAGKPIGDLFLPKPDQSRRSQPPGLLDASLGFAPAAPFHHHQQQQQQQQPPPAATSSSAVVGAHEQRNSPARLERPPSANSDHQLLGSQSEQQIYSECALILQRTYVKNIDDPKHQLVVPFGKTEQACISYKHIDKAVEQAKHKLKFREFAKMRKKPIPSGSPLKPPAAPLDVIHSSLEPPEDLVAAIGEINMAATQIIADQFDLSNDELLNGLPLIDMSKTKFWDICPLFVRQDLKCELTRFRTFTGHCNNLKHPTWGAARTPYARYLPPVHPDGIWVPRKSIVSEITFDVGIGHRETHANIAPSMRLPTIHNDDAHLGRRDFPSHHNIDELGPIRAPATSTSTTTDVAPLAPSPHRLGSLTPSSIEELARHADQELSEKLSDLAGAGSVHFVRRAPAANTGLVSPLDTQSSSASASASPLGLEASAIHFQQQQPDHLHNAMLAHEQRHLGHFRQHQAALAAAASNHHLQPMAPSVPIIQQAHKSRSIAQELPSARLVTSIVHRDVDVPNHDFTVLFMSWGQLLDHDMTRAAQPPTSIKCCPQPNGEQPAKHKLCLPIQVPPNDPFYSKFNVQCLEFRRTLAGVRPNCVLGPRVHQNANTSPIDANFVYGSSQEMADGLRLFKGGRLRDRDWFHREGLKPLLPAQEIDPDLACLGRPKDLFCFLAGDIRVNEQTHLTVLHTLYMREHNSLADRLSELNPHWDDERTFQEARHIVAAGVQHVLINEYIPLLIGRKMTELYNLTAQAHMMGAPSAPGHHHQLGPYSFWHGYDPSVTTSVSNSFAAAAFRQGHTFVQSTIDRFNKFHEYVSSEKLRHLFMQPFLLYQPGVMDELVSGLINRQSQSYDPFISEEISGHLFQLPEQEFGHDLAAINLQRGREQGLPGYNLFREWCGLPRAETFEQLAPYLTNHTAYQYSRIYKHVDDIDLWSGGISERKLPGAAIGPTFACIIARQFSNTRRGDRFWYENPGMPSSFTSDQLAEIRKVTLAKLLCSNADDLPTIQRWAFRMAHPILNPRVDCQSLPEIDLQFWQEE